MCFPLTGLTIIIGIGVFEGAISGTIKGDGSEYASTVAVMAGVCALLGSVFCLLELVGVCVK